MEVIEWWQRPFAWVFARRPDWRDRTGRALLWIGNRFYVALAVVLALIGAYDLFIQPLTARLSNANFDWLMTHRPVPYRPDPKIVVLDIDEASLAALAPQFGRWPWPRQVLADVGSRLEAAQVQAVLFDILFSDQDLANQGGDEAFDHYVMASRTSFYPIVRLSPLNDGASKIPVSMLSFAEPEPAAAGKKADGSHTVALLPPFFDSIIQSTRIGTNNIRPDNDNVVRWYDNYESLAGYRIPSLPYRMAQVLHWPVQQQGRSLINWPRGQTPYRTISYEQAYRAATANDTAYFAQFAGDVVLIGSTAPSLNDIKATPVETLHPGIYILATAIDNTRNNRFLKVLAPVWIWVLEILMLAASARLFIRTTRATAVTKYFFIIPGALLGISLVSISISDVLADLGLAAALVLSYFAIAKTFETNSRDFASGGGVFAASDQERTQGKLQVACLPVNLTRPQIHAMQLRPGSTIKFWDPPRSGLGRQWAGQGWVLWRWYRPGADGPGESEPALVWQDANAISPTDPFAMASVIAKAGQSIRQASNISK